VANENDPDAQYQFKFDPISAIYFAYNANTDLTCQKSIPINLMEMLINDGVDIIVSKICSRDYRDVVQVAQTCSNTPGIYVNSVLTTLPQVQSVVAPVNTQSTNEDIIEACALVDLYQSDAVCKKKRKHSDTEPDDAEILTHISTSKSDGETEPSKRKKAYTARRNRTTRIITRRITRSITRSSGNI
jgi:hypothetical protein